MYRKYFEILKHFLFIFILIRTYYLYSNRIFTMLVLFLLLITLMINDHIRKNKLYMNFKHLYDFSLLLTIFGTNVLAYYIRGMETNILYSFFPLAELLLLNGIRLKILFLVHFILYIILMISFIGITSTWSRLSSLIPCILGYFILSLTIYSESIIKTEKEETNKVNQKLQLANKKLQKYALEIKELTVSKERTLIAQELHDSLGHSLVALAMHLEFAKKIHDSNPDNVKNILIKSEEIAKSSISNLKETVSLIKSKREIKSFNDSVEDIINNFYILNNIKINYSINENLDNLNPAIKDAMYKTIRESITNSLEHGNSTKINIKILKKYNYITLILTDNGIGCSKIIKSNGLLGIENRITSLNGSVDYFNPNTFGFCINIRIPILMEEVQI